VPTTLQAPASHALGLDTHFAAFSFTDRFTVHPDTILVTVKVKQYSPDNFGSMFSPSEAPAQVFVHGLQEPDVLPIRSYGLQILGLSLASSTLIS
jgi:hypothetical protein